MFEYKSDHSICCALALTCIAPNRCFLVTFSPDGFPILHMYIYIYVFHDSINPKVWLVSKPPSLSMMITSATPIYGDAHRDARLFVAGLQAALHRGGSWHQTTYIDPFKSYIFLYINNACFQCYFQQLPMCTFQLGSNRGSSQMIIRQSKPFVTGQ